MSDSPVYKLLIFLYVVTLLTACANHQPVLYPNSHLASAGREVAREDIAECMEQARAAGAGEDTVHKTIRYTAVGATSGGATGAAVGAVTGRAGRSAAAGAAGGATAGLGHSLFTAGRPNAVFRNFTDRCLREKGYEPVGWN